MELLKALALGVVEGLTEFLPISSTGHLILVGHWLGVDTADAKPFADAFEVVIQLGAILAVVVHYRALIATRLHGLVVHDRVALRLAGSVVVAFIPAAVLGLITHHAVEALFGVWPVALALISGGVVMIAVEIWRTRKSITGDIGLEHVTWRRAMIIGVSQCLSLWPGMSRSMTTIVGGQLSGLSTSTAAEFSFLLAIPTLTAATLFKLVKARHVLLGTSGAATALAIGTVVSFFVAWAVIAAFLRFVRNARLTVFGVYRIVLGVAVLLLAHTGRA